MSSPAAAQRVAGTIGTVKWVLVVALLAFAVLCLVVGVVAGDSSAFLVCLGVAITWVISAVVTWVMFGWFEHTLSMLSQVALNTTRPGERLNPPLSQHV